MKKNHIRFIAQGSILTLALFSFSFAQPLKWTFEKGLEGWKAWGTSAALGDTSGLISLSEENAHGEKKSLRLSDTFSNGNPYTVVVVPVDPSKTYIWTGWIRAEKAGSASRHLWAMPASITGGVEKVAKFAGAPIFDNVPVGTGWQRFRILIPKLSAETTHLYLAVRAAQSEDPAWQGKLWLDDVSFQSQSFSSLDVSALVNRGFQDETSGDGLGGWTDQGNNDLRGMKTGAASLGGVPFQVLDPGKNGGNAVVALRPKQSPAFLETVAIPVNTFCDYLYLLHTAAWAGAGKPVGSVVWEYESGETATTSVISGDQVGDWWGGIARNALSQSYENVNPTRSPIYLFVGAFNNPFPEKKVLRAQLKSAGEGKAIWLVLSAMAGTGDNVTETARSSARDYSKWHAFSPSLKTADKPLLDLSFLLDAPAGKHGFVQSKNGKFVFADGTPARFFAVNIHSANGLLPSKEEAERAARTLSRYGVNLVRLHLMEYVLIDTSRADHQTPAAADTWDRFDYLVKCLKDRGIYVELDSVTGLSAVKFTEADNFDGTNVYQPHRSWTAFHPRLKEIGKNWAKILLTRTNSYTGKAFVDEPAVAMAMIINEQTVFFDWKESASPTPPSIRKLFTQIYNQWLVKTYKDRAGLEKAWKSADGKSALQPEEDPAEGTVVCWDLFDSILKQSPLAGPAESVHAPVRLSTLVRFLKELQTDYYKDFLAFLKSLGLKVPVAGSNILYHLPDLECNLPMGFTSQNQYYEHVQALDKGYGFPNIPEVLRDPLSTSALVAPSIAAVKIRSLPVTATEHDAMWPQEWRSTHNLSVYSSAALQDWDAVFWYCFMGGYGLTWEEASKMDGVAYPTVEHNDPALTGLLPAAALLFHRRDVSPSKNVVQVVHDEKESLTVNGRLRNGGFPYNYLTWVSRVEGVFGKTEGKPDFTIGASGNSFVMTSEDLKRPPATLGVELDAAMKQKGILASDRGLQEGRMVSDTGEVIRDFKKGLLLVNSPRTRAFSGFPAEPVKLGDVTFTLGIPFATLSLQSLENEPIAKAKTMLVTAVARAENDKDTIQYGQIVQTPNGATRGERIIVTPGGKRGVGSVMRIEPVDVKIAVPGGSLRVTPIAADGSALGTPFTVDAKDGRAEIILGKYATIWYLVERL